MFGRKKKSKLSREIDALRTAICPKDSPLEKSPAQLALEAVENDDVGYRMPDGTIYAGVSPSTKKPMFAAPEDAPLTLSFREAAQYAKNLNVGGSDGFRVPTKKELNTLYKNRNKGALKGSFNTKKKDPDSRYWSSNAYKRIIGFNVWFDNGDADISWRRQKSSVRCVRQA